MVGITELLNQIGDADIMIQNLDHCADTIDWTAKKGTKVKFGTDVPLEPVGDGFRLQKIGIVVWLDREKVASIMADNKKA